MVKWYHAHRCVGSRLSRKAAGNKVGQDVEMTDPHPHISTNILSLPSKQKVSGYPQTREALVKAKKVFAESVAWISRENGQEEVLKISRPEQEQLLLVRMLSLPLTSKTTTPFFQLNTGKITLNLASSYEIPLETGYFLCISPVPKGNYKSALYSKYTHLKHYQSGTLAPFCFFQKSVFFLQKVEKCANSYEKSNEFRTTLICSSFCHFPGKQLSGKPVCTTQIAEKYLHTYCLQPYFVYVLIFHRNHSNNTIAAEEVFMRFFS